MKCVFTLLIICALTIFARAQTSSLSDDALLKINFDQKPGSQVPGNLNFRDEQGAAVTLGQYFHTQPMILIMGYYGCPMLCTLVLNGVVENLRQLKPITDLRYQVIFVSIDPAETPSLARDKKATYVHSYGGRPDDWHFLTGDETSIRALAGAVGFHYVYDSEAKQYAHPSGFVVLTPEGKISRYFTGVTYSAKDLAAALGDATAGKSSVDPSPLNLLCFHYAPIHGKYGKLALNIVRGGGVATVLGLGFMLVRRKEKKGRPG